MSFCFGALRRTLLLPITFAMWGLFSNGLVFWVGIDEGKSFVQGFKFFSKGLLGGATFGFCLPCCWGSRRLRVRCRSVLKTGVGKSSIATQCCWLDRDTRPGLGGFLSEYLLLQVAHFCSPLRGTDSTETHGHTPIPPEGLTGIGTGEPPLEPFSLLG